MDFDAWKMTTGFAVCTNTQIHGTATITMLVYVFIFSCIDRMFSTLAEPYALVYCIFYQKLKFTLHIFYFSTWPKLYGIQLFEFTRISIEFSKPMETINCDLNLTFISIQCKYNTLLYCDKMLKLNWKMESEFEYCYNK